MAFSVTDRSIFLESSPHTLPALILSHRLSHVMLCAINYLYTLLMLNVDTLQMRNGRNLSLFATGTHKE